MQHDARSEHLGLSLGHLILHQLRARKPPHNCETFTMGSCSPARDITATQCRRRHAKRHECPRPSTARSCLYPSETTAGMLMSPTGVTSTPQGPLFGSSFPKSYDSFTRAGAREARQTDMLNFKVTFADGASLKLLGLADDLTLDGLRAALLEKTGISPEDQHVMAGYPPKVIDAPGESALAALGIRSGSVLVVKAPLGSGGGGGGPSRPATVFLRRVVPADNSCLFNAVGYALKMGKEGNGPMMRGLIRDAILANPDMYSEVFLGRPVSEYCAWILDDKSWGGEIEVSILAAHFKVEIVVFDVTSMSRLCYGEDQGYSQRMFLLYDGIHYDLVVESPSATASERQDIALFSINDFAKVEKASEVAVAAHQNHEFTDVNRFSIRCLVCRQAFVGQKEAQAHAQATGHQQFGEVR